MKWVGNITYIRTWEGFVYLATVLDCCTKKVVGYAMADQMRTSLPCETIDMAADKRPPREDETMFHSDRGCHALPKPSRSTSRLMGSSRGLFISSLMFPRVVSVLWRGVGRFSRVEGGTCD